MSALTSPRELGALFLKIGVIGFGGPAAHIAMMRREVVQERQWFSDQEFLEMAAVTNLIPGPNSTEMAMHIGSQRGGVRGLVISGVTFIIPAVIIVAFISWLYAEYGTNPWVFDIRYGILPVIIAIVAHAVLMLSRSLIKKVEDTPEQPEKIPGTEPSDFPSGSGRLTQYRTGSGWLTQYPSGGGRLHHYLTGGSRLVHYLTGGSRLTQLLSKQLSRARLLGTIQAMSLPFLSAVLYLFGWNELFILLIAGVLALVTDPSCFSLRGNKRRMLTPAVPFIIGATQIQLSSLALLFLKIGSILYGSGYVLLAFLERELVHNRALLTPQQLLDAVAIGQVTPGPVFSTATFIGWQLQGISGAVVATIGIFAPSFVFVGLLSRILPWIKRHSRASVFLRGITAASLGLMAGVVVRLADSALTDVLTWATGSAALLLLIRTKINTVVLIGSGVGISLLRIALI
jgi:chromate transporter